MTSEIVESALANIGIFSPSSQPANTKKSKKTRTSSLEKRQSVEFIRTCLDKICI